MMNFVLSQIALQVRALCAASVLVAAVNNRFQYCKWTTWTNEERRVEMICTAQLECTKSWAATSRSWVFLLTHSNQVKPKLLFCRVRFHLPHLPSWLMWRRHVAPVIPCPFMTRWQWWDRKLYCRPQWNTEANPLPSLIMSKNWGIVNLKSIWLW